MKEVLVCIAVGIIVGTGVFFGLAAALAVTAILLLVKAGITLLEKASGNEDQYLGNFPTEEERKVAGKKFAVLFSVILVIILLIVFV